MIKVRNQIPAVYTDASRDFQLLARAFEIDTNFAKTVMDLAYSNRFLNKNSDISLAALYASTLGFELRHTYTSENLLAICLVFKTLIAKKGTIESIQLACDTLLAIQGIPTTIIIDKDKTDPFLLNIYIPKDLTDIVLIEDLCDYLLPAGYIYQIITGTSGIRGAHTDINLVSKQQRISIDNNELSTITIKADYEHATSTGYSAYDSTATYSVGDKVINNGLAYECTAPVNTPEEFNPMHWVALKEDYIGRTSFTVIAKKQDENDD